MTYFYITLTSAIIALVHTVAIYLALFFIHISISLLICAVIFMVIMILTIFTLALILATGDKNLKQRH